MRKYDAASAKPKLRIFECTPNSSLQRVVLTLPLTLRQSPRRNNSHIGETFWIRIQKRYWSAELTCASQVIEETPSTILRSNYG